MPRFIVHYPPGNSLMGWGERIDNGQAAIKVLRNLIGGTDIVLPINLAIDVDPSGGISQADCPQWHVTIISDDGKHITTVPPFFKQKMSKEKVASALSRIVGEDVLGNPRFNTAAMAELLYRIQGSAVEEPGDTSEGARELPVATKRKGREFL